LASNILENKNKAQIVYWLPFCFILCLLTNLGLIIVDEEHERVQFKQYDPHQRIPRHRDAAIVWLNA